MSIYQCVFKYLYLLHYIVLFSNIFQPGFEIDYRNHLNKCFPHILASIWIDGQSNSGGFVPANVTQSNKSTSNPGYPLPGYSSPKPVPGSQVQFPPDRPFHPSPPFRRHPRPNRIGGYPAPNPKWPRKPFSNQNQNKNGFASNPWKPFKPMYYDFVNMMKPWKQKMANWK